VTRVIEGLRWFILFVVLITYLAVVAHSFVWLLSLQFDEFQQGSKVNPRRPTCNNLYEVFNNIRDDGGSCMIIMQCTFWSTWNGQDKAEGDKVNSYLKYLCIQEGFLKSS
jgi:hypothetical protein